MNPLKKLISEHQKRGGTVISVFADRREVGIRVRHRDFTTTHQIPSDDFERNKKWVAEALPLLNQCRYDPIRAPHILCPRTGPDRPAD